MTYVDTKVTHPCAASFLAGAAAEDGYAARQAEAGKHSRYPPNPQVRGRLVPLAVETYGRLGEEGLRFLRKAAGRACARTSTLAVLGEEGPPAVLGAWLERQSPWRLPPFPKTILPLSRRWPKEPELGGTCGRLD